MKQRSLCIFTVLLVLLPAGCGYRFVDPFPASDYALISVRNTTGEADIASLLEEEMRRAGGFKERSTNRLSVTITGFSETVESVDSAGTPVRQKLVMDVSWMVEEDRSTHGKFGKEVVLRSYPYSNDLSTLDWNRRAAVRLLTEMAARRILERLGEQP